jgi:uncharacterized membrane protein YdbT with pleckstrin-like domain
VPFPPKLLNDNEQVVLDLHPHWARLFWPVSSVVGAVIFAILLNSAVDNVVAKWSTLVIVLVAVVWFLIRYGRWRTTNFVVTTDRLVYRSGLFAKHGKEIPLERVNDISFHQSVFERLIGAGDLIIESAGERGQTHFRDIRKPSAVQNEIYRQIEASQNRNADRMAGRRELSVPEQLEKLDDLRQKGVISQAEFDQKKTQLLDRM